MTVVYKRFSIIHQFPKNSIHYTKCSIYNLYIQTKNVLHYAASAATARYLLFIYCLLAKSNQRPFALACWPYSSFLYLPAKCQQCGHNLISPFDWLWMDGFSTWLGGSLYSPIFRRSIHQVHLHRFPRLIGLRARHQMHHSNAAATIAYTSDRPKFWAYYSSFEYVLPEKMLLKPLTK